MLADFDSYIANLCQLQSNKKETNNISYMDALLVELGPSGYPDSVL